MDIRIKISLIVIIYLNITLGTVEASSTITVPDDYPTIQQAVDNAVDGDKIFVKSETYAENVVINKDLTLEGEDMETTIIDGMGSDSIHISSAGVVINGFTIKNGNYGIYAYNSILHLSNLTIKNNVNTGVYFVDGRTSLTLKDSLIENNSGSGFILAQSNFFTGNVIIEKNTIRNNSGSGLIIDYHYAQDRYDATIKDNLIINNTENGIYLNDAYKAVIENNTIQNTEGAGIYLYGRNIDVEIINITIQNVNSVGIYARHTRYDGTVDSYLTVKNATIENCGSYGVYINRSFPAPGTVQYHHKNLTVINSVIQNNGGGLIYEDTIGGEALIENNIIRDNRYSGLIIWLKDSIKRPDITIKDNLIENVTYDYGIYISQEGSLTYPTAVIINNTISDVESYGICCNTTYAAIIENNSIKNGKSDGIFCRTKILRTLVNNKISDNAGYGIYLNISSYYLYNGIIRNNILLDNKYGISLNGKGVASYKSLNIDTSNTIDEKPIYYLVEENNKVLDGISAGYLGVVSSKNITVKNLEIAKNGQGILLVNTSDSEIASNNLLNNEFGIYLYRSNNNVLKDNNVESNTICGINIEFSNNNMLIDNNISNNFYGIFLSSYSNYSRIYHNNFINNILQAYSAIFNTNSWDNSYPSGGNYWSDYIGGDLSSGPNQDHPGSDGIGDNPYNIENGSGIMVQDRYPFMKMNGWSADITSPIVTNPTANHEIPDDTDNEPLWGETAQLNVTVTDDSGVAGVTVNLSEIGGSAAKPMTNIGDNIWYTTTNASGGTLPKLYYLTINATGISGNSNTSVAIPLKVMKNGDTTGNGVVNIGDALRCANNVSFPGNAAYAISSPYVTDVTGNSVINIGDCLRLANNVSFLGNPLYILK